MKKIDKLIVTNKSAIQEKYKGDAKQIFSLLNALVKADKKKGTISLLVFVDDKKQLKQLKVSTPAATATNTVACKRAIDKLHAKFLPDYIMIFGAPDIFPHIDLVNPLYKKDVDPDHHVKSDLPYACDAPYSTDISNFLSPTRVVGRLPDINGVRDLKYVKSVINSAIKFVAHPASVYKKYFSVTAHEWHISTELSLKHIFDNNTHMNQVPYDGPEWTDEQLSSMSHFVNCHGSPQDFHWFGQRGDSYPISVYAKQIDGKIKAGTIAAVECCYGAQLFDPGLNGDVKPLCNTYLGNGAIAFMGSTSLAYGPPRSNDQADLITQYFLGFMIWSGASSGRALLEARHKYILNHGPDLSPTDLKTVAQFYLLGDPSIHPVNMSNALTMDGSNDYLRELYAAKGRGERRKYLSSKGNSLKSFVNKVVSDKKSRMDAKSKKIIHEVLKHLDVSTRESNSFSVKQNATNRKTFGKSSEAEARFHVFSEIKNKNLFSHTLTTFKELGGKVVSVQHFHRK